MGRFGPLVNVIAIAWCLFIAVVFMLPPNELVLWTMLGLGALMLVYWFTRAKRTFGNG
jgi:hypothetical protein